MPNKNIVQDVVPPKKSIRNIKLSERGSDLSSQPTKRASTRVTKEPVRESSRPEPMLEDFSRSVSIKTEQKPIKEPESPVNNKPPFVINNYSYEYDEPKKPSKKILYAGVIISVILVAFGISALFKSAKITLVPKNQAVTVNNTFTAKKDASSGGLVYQVVTLVKDVEKNVEATGESMVQKKAIGTIVIYNSYNTQSQKLVATTRFQTQEGLIYRLISPVTVPGISTKSGKTVAGSIEAQVEADKPGSEYNIGLKDFTIPGLKGDPKYSKIYARSKTEMKGGFSGMQKTVSSETINQANKEMEESLKASLSKDISSQIPADFVLYPTSLIYNFEPITQLNNSTGGVVLKKRATATAIIFDKGILARTLLAKLIPESVNDVVKVTNLDELDFSYASDTNQTQNTANSITFSIKGEPNFVWVFDENKVKSEVLGLSKKEAQNAISKYPTIKEAWIETKPFWNRTIPTDSNKVTLINTLTK